MSRIAAIALTATLTLIPATANAAVRAPRPPRPPAPLTLTVVESCFADGYTQVAATLTSVPGGTYTVLSQGDADYATPVGTVTVPAGGTATVTWPISYPQQLDVTVGTVQRTVPAAVCARPW